MHSSLDAWHWWFQGITSYFKILFCTFLALNFAAEMKFTSAIDLLVTLHFINFQVTTLFTEKTEYFTFVPGHIAPARSSQHSTVAQGVVSFAGVGGRGGDKLACCPYIYWSVGTDRPLVFEACCLRTTLAQLHSISPSALMRQHQKAPVPSSNVWIRMND